MPLPVNVPCTPCRADQLHVWDSKLKAWKCNTCGNVKRNFGENNIDEFMRRRYRRKRSGRFSTQQSSG